MIVFSTNLVLSASEALNVNNPVIGYRNIVTPLNVASTSFTTGFPSSNLGNPMTHLKWVAGVNTGDEFITIATNTLDDIDYLAVAKHNFGTAQCSVSVEGDLAGDSPDLGFVELVQETMLADDVPVMFRFTPQPLTSIRLRIRQGLDTPEAAVVYVGKLLVMERSIKVDVDITPINLGRISKVVNGKSTSGNFLGRIMLGEVRESAADFDHITPDWYRSDFDPFVVASQEVPFFFVWNPSEYPFEVGYCWTTEDPKPNVHPVTRRVGVQLKLQGVA
jgi:hypothetical protein